MTKRSSSSKRASSSATSRRSGRRTSESASSGRTLVACPQCGAQFRVAADFKEKIECTQCHRTFFAKAVAGKAPRPVNHTPLIVGSIFGLVFLVVIGVAIRGGFSSTPNTPSKPAQAPVAKTIETGWRSERVQSVLSFAQGVFRRSDFDVEKHSDLAALQRKLDVETGQPIRAALADDRNRLRQLILAKLYDGEEGAIFRDIEFDDGTLPDPAFATSSTGKVELSGMPRDTDTYVAERRAVVMFDFTWDAPYAKVTGWELVQPLIPKRRPAAKPVGKPLQEIAAPETAERMVGSQKVRVKESPVVPLDHLADTPEALRKEIDSLIAQLVDIDGSPQIAGRAMLALKRIGRPAIPRLLNQFNFHRGETELELKTLGRVDRQLRDMTGVAFNFSPALQVVGENVGASPEERESAKRQWFAWWREWHDRDYTYNIDKADDESVFLTEEQKRALEAQKKGTDPTAPRK